ncbi:UDP-glucosyltransferase 2-like [Drosophila bipectinata]|uniref:UDP-glucosyltransferase 2-like n=1 Tax=Drosophila bipectinata TaxID=42026 RepID=UPI0038B2EE24
MKFILLLLFLGIECPTINAANILGVFGTHSPSHTIVNMAVMKALADQGHNITVVLAAPPKMKAHENITIILAPPTQKRIQDSKEHIANASKEKQSLWKTMMVTLLQSEFQIEAQYEFLMHPNLRNLYEKPQTKFDLVILGMLANGFQLGIAAKLHCPVILTWVRLPMPFADFLVGNIADPAYVPTLTVGLEPGQKTMGFGLRLTNFFKYTFTSIFNEVFAYKMNKYYERAFGNESDPDFPTYSEMNRRVSLLFYNYHAPSEGPIRPVVPQSIEIGGIQVKEQPDPLPKDLSEFLDNAKEGAIFFSLGSNVDTNTFSPQVLNIVYKVLSKLPQRVIWKWQDLDNKPGNASNIYFGKWLPQDDILAHHKTKLFITHAGKGSVAEAQFHGVPMVALPLFADQPSNSEILAKSGFGRWLDVLTLTEEKFKEAILDVMENSTYREAIGKFSALYRDRPLTARQSVVYWTEYVLRHQGAYHLQSPLIQMDFVSRNNIDVYGIILFIGVIFSLIISIIFKWVFRKISRVFHRKNNQKKVNKLKSN